MAIQSFRPIAMKALPGVLAREPRGHCGCCGEPIHREDPYSREAVATRTPTALVSASDALNRIRRDGFAFAHRDLPSRYTFVVPLRRETVKRPWMSMGISAFYASLRTSYFLEINSWNMTDANNTRCYF